MRLETSANYITEVIVSGCAAHYLVFSNVRKFKLIINNSTFENEGEINSASIFFLGIYLFNTEEAKEIKIARKSMDSK